MPVSDEAAPQPTHRHKKRGTDYVLIGYGRMQVEPNNWVTLRPSDCGEWGLGPWPVDMREVAIYRSATDPTDYLVCPREEADSVFEVLPDAPAPKGGA